MELLQLKYFCESAATENFSQTAKKFGVPPSDVSQSIRRLERELSVPLFVRRANSITISESGREFYIRISKALSLIDEAKAILSDDASKGKIKLCINANRRVVMEVVEKYRRIYPDVEIVTNHFVDPMTDDFDLIIESDDPRLSEYNKTLFISEDIMLAVRTDNPLAQFSCVDVASLVNVPFVTMSDKSSIYHITFAICRDFGFSPRIAMQSDDPFYVRKCVELGLGVAFVPAFSWKGQFSDSIVLKEVSGYKRNTYIYTNSQKHIPGCARTFFAMLKNETEENMSAQT